MQGCLESPWAGPHAGFDPRQLLKGMEAHHCFGFHCRQLFKGIDAQQGAARCAVRVMFLEIHNEEVKDLLHPDIPARVCSTRCIDLVPLYPPPCSPPPPPTPRGIPTPAVFTCLFTPASPCSPLEFHPLPASTIPSFAHSQTTPPRRCPPPCFPPLHAPPSAPTLAPPCSCPKSGVLWTAGYCHQGDIRWANHCGWSTR